MIIRTVIQKLSFFILSRGSLWLRLCFVVNIAHKVTIFFCCLAEAVEVASVSLATNIVKHPAYLYYMQELQKANYDGLFFITLNVVAWVDVFSRKDYINILIENLRFCQDQRGLEIYGYVIMTNYLQMLAAQPQKQLNKVLGRFKSYTAKQILSAIEDNPNENRQDWLLHIFRFHAKYKAGYDEYHF